jgi:hypothetical protein
MTMMTVKIINLKRSINRRLNFNYQTGVMGLLSHFKLFIKLSYNDSHNFYTIFEGEQMNQ